MEKKRLVNTIGMFDLIKGLGILLIILVHTVQLYTPRSSNHMSFFASVLYIYTDVALAIFFIISGYGFRKTKIKQCCIQQTKMLIKPYLYTALVTVILRIIFRCIFVSGFSSAIKNSRKYIAGFLLGTCRPTKYFGHNFASIGPAWFILALAIGWIILNVLENIVSERFMPLAILGSATLGWLLCFFVKLPFCLNQVFLIVPFLFLGHYAKKKQLLLNKLPAWLWILFIISLIGMPLGAHINGITDNIPCGNVSFGPLTTLFAGIIALVIIYVFIRWNYKRNILTKSIEFVGKNSLIFLCLHTVEQIAFPWSNYTSIISSSSLGIFVFLVLRLCFIAILYLLLQNIKKGMLYLKDHYKITS